MISPKQIGTICFAIFSFVFPSFATEPDIDTATASCNDDVFNSNTGPVNIEVNWEPNEINLRWYNNNTLMENVADVSSYCIYDSTLTPPATIPTKTGYTFKGWKVRPTYNFTQLNTRTDGTERWAIGLSDGADYCWYASGHVSCTAYPEYYKEIKRYEWKVLFDWGEIYGSSYCSAKSGNSNRSTWNNASSNWLATYAELESASGTKQYCWCQATGYKPSNNDTLYGPESSSAGSFWVFLYDRSSASSCASGCAMYCSYFVFYNSGVRKALFGISQ